MYLLQRNIINSLKELKKRPLKMILYIAMIGIIIMSLVLGTRNSGEGAGGSIRIYKSIFLAFILVFTFIGLKSGLEKGNNLFRLSDANLLFPAPIKPQLVLFYGFIRQMGSNLFLILILGFQMPNLYMNFPIKSYGWAIILLGTFLFSVLTSIIGVFIYSIGSTKELYRKWINYILYGLAGLVLTGLVYSSINIGKPLDGAINFLNKEFFNYIPIVGWLINIYTAAIIGFDFMTLLNIALLIVTGGLFLLVIYKLDLDYYEEALNNSITKEEELIKAKKGSRNRKERKFKSEKSLGKINYTRAKAIFSKQILEAKKTGFVFIDINTISVLAFSLVFAFIVRENGVNFLLYMMVYMNAIVSQSNLWSMELEKHYIYLIPERSVKKIWYASLLENIKGLIIGLITFSIATFIYDISLVDGLILAIAYGSFTTIILFSELVIRRMLGGRLSLLAERFVRILILVLFLIPGIILSVFLGTFINKYTGGQGIYLILISYNGLIAFLLMVLSRGIFEKIDMR